MGLTKPKIVGGVSLPDLTNPAEASDILSGKEAIAEDGGVLAGSHVCKQLHELFPALSNPAGAADVASGKQIVDATGAVVSGTLEKLELPEYSLYMNTNYTSTTNTITVDGTTNFWTLGATFTFSKLAKISGFLAIGRTDGGNAGEEVRYHIFTKEETVKFPVTTNGNHLYDRFYRVRIDGNTLYWELQQNSTSSKSTYNKIFCVVW